VAKYTYNINNLDPTVVEGKPSIPASEDAIVDKFAVNNLFAKDSHKLEIHVYSVDNNLLQSDQNFSKYTQLANSAGAGKDGASNIYLDPVLDIKDLGYENGDVRILYNFLDNLYSDAKIASKFFIKEISGDRTELKLQTFELSDEKVQSITEELKAKLLDNSYFSEYKLNFYTNKFASVINIDTLNIDGELSVIVKLSEPLGTEFGVNTTLYVEEKVSDSVYYEVETTLEEDIVKVPKLKGPNFSVAVEDDTADPTQFFNYNELFSFPVTNSYAELRSLFNEAGAQISIDHSKYENFIHFSSAEERLRNFKYKLDLIKSYESSITTINDTSYTGSGASGSTDYYEGLIKGLINNFDHYDNFLYFSSGSKSWPKSTTNKPHINYASSHVSASSWFNSQVVSASNFDATNFDVLTNTVPRFIREDSDNEPYILLTHMIAQHFDNLWIYFRQVSSKYDSDNRLDFGISKDLVKSAIESFGVKLYSNNQNSDNLFAAFTGETVQTGSLTANSMSIATSASYNDGSSSLEHLQPVAKNNYQKEIHKRIYHNLPYLMKTKGTERGIRALINCYGLPESILTIEQKGGSFITGSNFFGPDSTTATGSLSKVRLDNTGSVITGSTLSLYTSIVDKTKTYTDDQHELTIGFDIAKAANSFIEGKISSSFSIDDFIGDPRDRRESKYELLKDYSDNINQMGWNWNDLTNKWEEADYTWNTKIVNAKDARGFVRLMNYLDGSLFRTLRQFVPARAKLKTGAIIQSHKLHRSKAPQVSSSIFNEQHSGSLRVATITSSQAGVFDMSSSYGFTTNYSHSIVTPVGRVQKNVTDESPQLTGEFSGSLLIATDGEVGSDNPFVNLAQPRIVFDITCFNLSLPLPPACVIALSSSFVGNYFQAFATGTVGDSISGSIQLTYPTLGSTSDTTLAFTHDYDTFEFFSVVAAESYASTFQGWYKQFPTGSVSNRLTTDTTLTIYYQDEATKGNKFYAVFDP
tara:strand:+ start:313 stop:3258 length:2946 start_codon:yes stop_codon:yes gene_type:complete